MSIATRKTLDRVAVIAAIGTCIALTGRINAQSGQQIMIMEQSDGEGGTSSMVHFTMPDFASMRKPDFVRSDLPIFDKTLVLRETQRETLERLLEEYLASFAAIAEETLPPASKDPHIISLGNGEAWAAGGDGPPIDGEFTFNTGGEGGAADMGALLAELEGADGDGEPRGRIMIGIQATSSGDVTGEDVNVVAGGDDEPGVMIAIDGGEDLPPEIREQLEAHAKEMAAKLQKQLEDQQQDGAGPDFRDGMFGSIEERAAHFDDLAQRAETFKQAKAALRQDFTRKVSAELDDEQIGRWPKLERTLTRHKTLPNSRLSGEDVDLIRALDALELAEADRRRIAEEENAYELNLHDALVRRNMYVDDASSRVDEAIQKGEPDKALSIVDRATELRLAVRNINQRYADALAAGLPDDRGETFRSNVQRESYPRVYNANIGLKAFEAARRLDGLSEESLISILELETAYRRELEFVNERIQQTIDREEPLQSRRAIEHLAESMNNPGSPSMHFSQDDPIREAFADRRGLDDRYMTQLYAMLTPEQVATLPRKPSQRKQRQPFIIRETTGPK